jgi:hypothetical protein
LLEGRLTAAAVQWLELLLHIGKASASIISLDANYTDTSSFFSFNLSEKRLREYTEKTTTTYFHFLIIRPPESTYKLAFKPLKTTISRMGLKE